MEILKNFFTHKDFLPPPEVWQGTLFTPLQIVFCSLVALFIVYSAYKCSKKSESHQKKVYFVLWALMFITEPLISVYDCYAGREFFADWGSILPLWHCSIFLFAAPFAIFGKGKVRESACGYICTLGLLGGLVNFIYPATYLSRYSCISMAGFRTVFYHGAMIFTALTMLLSGYHSFKGVKRARGLLLPAIPALIASVPANIVNFTLGTDYMFFKLESFFFAPIGRATPDWLSVIIVYFIIIAVHAIPYLPPYLAKKRTAKEEKQEDTELVMSKM